MLTQYFAYTSPDYLQHRGWLKRRAVPTVQIPVRTHGDGSEPSQDHRRYRHLQVTDTHARKNLQDNGSNDQGLYLPTRTQLSSTLCMKALRRPPRQMSNKNGHIVDRKHVMRLTCAAICASSVKQLIFNFSFTVPSTW